MKRLSKIYRPTLVLPKNAVVKKQEPYSNSQRLLAECGFVRSTAPGCFALLPLATRSLHKLERLVRSALASAGGQEVSLPTLAKADTWRQTGRLDEMREELFLLRDRHDREYVLSPTHEESITELLAETRVSHNQLPLLLYQISSKFRDEKRPRHGLLRAREFTMCDAYSFHSSESCARDTYDRVTDAYTRLFARLRVPYHRVAADSGSMGGSVSHEWHYAAAAGEDVLYACDACGTVRQHAPASRHCDVCSGVLTSVQSIEVAHTFVLGTRYSLALGADPLAMCCYGVGLTRLLAAALESLSQPDRLRWPNKLAPYTALVVGPKEGSAEFKEGGGAQAETLARALASRSALEDDVVLDDRTHLTVGRRLVEADKAGYPLIIVVGRRGLELHTHTDSARIFTSAEQLLQAVEDLVRSMDDEDGDYVSKVVQLPS